MARRGRRPVLSARTGKAVAAALFALAAAGEARAQACTSRTIANVVAIDQFIWYNRLGAREPNGMMFALAHDVVNPGGGAPTPGNATLRPGKRPRPLVLRVNVGGCLEIRFTNLLDPTPRNDQPHTRAASVHVVGMQLRTSILDDGSAVGLNASSLVEPGQSRTYTLFAEREGTYLLYSTAATTGGEGNGGQIAKGLFGAVNVEPPGSEWYRSQLTRVELDLATRARVDSFPVIAYDTTYPSTYLVPQLRGRPIVRMTRGDTLIHSDLYAIITGPGRGNFAANAFPGGDNVPVYPERLRPFRENTVIFHDEVGLKQAFEQIFDSDLFAFTLHGGRDAFSINYGTGGIGAEILANRFGLGPMRLCNDCKFEEFFLSSWAVGDPAMVVDVPAAADFDTLNPPAPGTIRATKAFFPADPSNVFHSYLNDHVKIRNLHAGPKEHHIFHLHAHQWLHTPNTAGSNYDDSQAIGPGGGYTYEIAFGGAGNRTNTPGDAIYHCHFYPHFAQGMWALWRVHDVFERGTQLDGDGRPVAGARALPDGEIAAGTPIPAVVPLPGYALAPFPTDTMPGFPFYIPGKAGHRPPRPPLDVVFDTAAGVYRDGGLPRHYVLDGVSSFPQLNTRDFSKVDSTVAARFLPDTGTLSERRAMRFHAKPFHVTPIAGNWGTTGQFETNGRPPVAGAPYADPCPAPANDAVPRRFRAASLQIRDTARYNKARWGFPQHRMFALWSDVDDFRNNVRAPEPMFLRVYDKECIDYHLVNLIPEHYEMDDFQVETPTDIVGQHIHLVKFDVTSSDGSANGWNYEDGSFAPGGVRERIAAIRLFNNCGAKIDPPQCPAARQHPNFPDPDDLGAQETVQRWWADAVARERGGSSRQGTVFTHDHFGPSTHQQTGLYAGLLPEDSGTTWRDPETGVFFGTDPFDGGPTSWRADILYPNPDSSVREFALQVADFTLAYGREGFAGPLNRTPPINPPGKDEEPLPILLRPPLANNLCPNQVDTPPCPEIISADEPGTMVWNYRAEPLAMRIRTPGNAQAAGAAGNLSRVFSSLVPRADGRFSNFGPYGARPGEIPGDPFTPLLRVYEDDRILVRLLTGAHEESHNVAVRGTRWAFEPNDSVSGWRASQGTGISEFFEFNLDPLLGNAIDSIADYQYESAAVDDRWNGTWGIIRAYRYPRRDLLPLSEERPVSTSREAAQSTAAMRAAPGAKTAPDGWVAEYPDTIPDPNDPTTWEGTLDPDTLVKDTSLATASDSLRLGTGGRATGGIEYESYEFDAATGAERVISDDPDAATKGLSYAGTTTETKDVKGQQATVSGGLWTGTGGGFFGICPWLAPIRFFDVTAVDARRALPGRRLVYNSRTANGGPLTDSTAILYVRTADLDWFGRLRPNRPIEPLVLRANAGDCIYLLLRNYLGPLAEADGWNTWPMIVDRFNANEVDPSARVGLRPQLVAYDVQYGDGSEVGVNRNTTIPQLGWRIYQWYAGDVSVVNGVLTATPIEFGATNLMSSDPMKHSNKGAIGALVIEPKGSTHQTDPGTYAEATITRANGKSFRELVLLYQDDVNLRFGSEAELPALLCEDGTPKQQQECEEQGLEVIHHTFAAGDAVPNTAEAEDPEDSGQKAFNYRTEPLWFRMGFAPDANLNFTRTLDFRASLTDAQVGGRPQTPIFDAVRGNEVRIRVLEPGGHARNHVLNVHGHLWDELPYLRRGSLVIGPDSLSERKGARDGHGPTNHHDLVPQHGAGGYFGITGEYLYRDQPSFQFDGGLWGLFRVRSPFSASSETTTAQPVEGSTINSANTRSSGNCVVNASTGVTTCTNR